MTVPTATLMRQGVAFAPGEVLEIGPEGLDVAVKLPPETVVIDAACHVRVGGSRASVAMDPSRCTVATSEGPGYSKTPVTWVTIDWRTRRTLAQIIVEPEGAVPAGVEGLLKLADSGPWYAPTPSSLALGHNVQLPTLKASRLMVAFVTRDGKNHVPASIRLKRVSISTLPYPPNLSLSLDEERPIANRDEAFCPGEVWSIKTALLEALRHIQQASQEQEASFILRLRSDAPGRLAGLSLELTTACQLQRWTNDRETITLGLEPETPVCTEVTVPPGAEFERIRCRVNAELAQESCLSPEPVGPSTLAHRCRPGMFAAQALPHIPVGSKLCGLDIQVRPLSATTSIKLYLHHDRFGKPDTEVLAPLGDSTQALQEPGQAPWPSRWISMDLSGLRVPESRAWWLVLTVEQGDVLWFVDPVAEGSSEARQTLYRRHGEHWQERRLPAAPPGEGQKRGPPRAARARTRVRVQAKHPPEVTLQISARGNHVTARPDEAGVVSLTRTEVQKLSGHTSNSQHNSKHNSKHNSQHNLVVAVQAPIRGRVSLSELCVRLKPRRTNLHFPDSINMS